MFATFFSFLAHFHKKKVWIWFQSVSIKQKSFQSKAVRLFFIWSQEEKWFTQIFIYIFKKSSLKRLKYNERNFVQRLIFICCPENVRNVCNALNFLDNVCKNILRRLACLLLLCKMYLYTDWHLTEQSFWGNVLSTIWHTYFFRFMKKVRLIHQSFW